MSRKVQLAALILAAALFLQPLAAVAGCWRDCSAPPADIPHSSNSWHQFAAPAIATVPHVSCCRLDQEKAPAVAVEAARLESRAASPAVTAIQPAAHAAALVTGPATLALAGLPPHPAPSSYQTLYCTFLF